MVNPGTFFGQRKIFLDAQKDIYAAAVQGKHVADIQRRYFKRFPITLPHSEDPSEDFLNSIDDDAPDPELAPARVDASDVEGVARAQRVFELQRMELKLRKEQIKRRLQYQYNKSMNSKPTFEVGSTDLMATLMSKLTGNVIQKPHQKMAYNLWGPQNRDTVDPVFKARVEEGHVPVKQQAALRSAIYKEFFAKLPEEERKSWVEKAEVQHKEALDKVMDTLKAGVSTAPEDRQRVIESLPQFIEPILDLIAEHTGWKVSFIAGGPEPADGGRLNMISIHSGVISGTVKMNFGRSERTAYKDFVVPTFGHFLKKCYSIPECRSRALPEKDQGDFSGLASVDEQDSVEVHTFDDGHRHAGEEYVKMSSPQQKGSAPYVTPKAKAKLPTQSTGGNAKAEPVGGKGKSVLQTEKASVSVKIKIGPPKKKTPTASIEPKRSSPRLNTDPPTAASYIPPSSHDAASPTSRAPTPAPSRIPTPSPTEQLAAASEHPPRSASEGAVDPSTGHVPPPRSASAGAVGNSSPRHSPDIIVSSSKPSTPPQPLHFSTATCENGLPRRGRPDSTAQAQGVDADPIFSNHSHNNSAMMIDAPPTQQTPEREAAGRLRETATTSSKCGDSEPADVNIVVTTTGLLSLVPSTTAANIIDAEMSSIPSAIAPAPIRPSQAPALDTATPQHALGAIVVPDVEHIVVSEAVQKRKRRGSSMSGTQQKKKKPSPTPSLSDDRASVLSAPWFMKALELFSSTALGLEWDSLLRNWIKFEENAATDSAERLECHRRPRVITNWIRRARASNFRPDIEDVAAFEADFKAWWGSVQPPWRLGSDGVILGSENATGDWECVRHLGVNGLVSVVAALFFWGTSSQLTADGRQAWITALQDVSYVIKCLLI